MLKNADIMAKIFIIIFLYQCRIKKGRRIKMRLEKVGTFAFDKLASTKNIDANELVRIAEKCFSEGGKSSAKVTKLMGSLDGLAALGKAKITSKLTPNVADKIEKFAE